MNEQIAHGHIQIDLNDADAIARLRRVEAEFKSKMDSIGRMEAKAEIDANLAKFDAAIERVKARIAELKRERAEVVVQANKDRLDREIESAKLALDRLSAHRAEAKITAQGAARTISEIEAVERIEKAREDAELRRQRLLEDIQRKQQLQFRRDEAEAYRVERVRVKEHELSERAQLDMARELERAANLRRAYARLTDQIEEHNKLKRPLGGEERVKFDLDTEGLYIKLKVLEEQLKLHKVEIPAKIDVDSGLKAALEKLPQTILGKIAQFGSTNVNVGPINASLAAVAGGALSLLPIIVSLGGAVTSLAGTLVNGLGGAAAIGGGVLSGLAMNFGGLFMAVKPVVGEFKEASKAISKAEEASTKYGAGSKQAKKATEEMNNILKGMNPNIKKTIEGWDEMTKKWAELTKPVRGDIAGITAAATSAAKTLLPIVAKSTDETGSILHKHIDSIFAHLKMPEQTEALASLGKSANQFLDPALEGLERFGAGLLHIGEAGARIFAGQLGRTVRDLGREFDHATQPGAKLDETVRTLGEDAIHITKLFFDLGKVLFDVLEGGAESGDKLVQSMDHGLQGWDRFLKSTEGKSKMATFFEESDNFAKSLFHTLFAVVGLLGKWAISLQPVINGFGDVMTFTEGAVESVGKLVGLTSPVKQLGTLMGIAFGLSRLGSFLGLLERIKATFTELGAVNGLRSILTGKLTNITINGKNAAEMIEAAMSRGGAKAAEDIRASMQVGASDVAAAEQAGGAVAASEQAAAIEGAGIVAGGEQATAIEGASIASGGAGSALSGIGVKGLLGRLGASVLGGGAAYFAGSTAADFIGLKGADHAAASFGAGGAAFGGLAAPAVGALLGTEIAPVIGTAVGAGIGISAPYVVQFLEKVFNNHSIDYGKKFAQGFGAPFQGLVAPGRLKSLESRTASDYNTAKGLTRRIQSDEHQIKAGSETNESYNQINARLPQLRKQEIAEYRHLGEDTAKAWIEGQSSIRYHSTFQVSQDAITQLNKLPKAAQAAGAAAMLEWASSLEKHGELPKGAVSSITHDIEKKFPELTSFLTSQGYLINGVLANAMKLPEPKQQLARSLQSMREMFHTLPNDPNVNGTNLYQRVAQTLRELHDMSATSTASTKRVMIREFVNLHHELGSTFDAMITKLSSSSKELTKVLGSNSQRAKEIAAKNFGQLAASIESAVASGALSSKQGAEYIHAAVNAMLKSFGAKALPEITISAAIGNLGKAAVNGIKFAAGGLVQIGNAGERGHDSVPLNVGGQDIVVAPGEQVAVFNHHQLPIINERLADYGGLPGFFSTVDKPHYLAKGGIVGYAKGGNVGAMVAEANAINSMHYPYVWGGGHNPGFSGPYDCSGALSAVLHAGGYLSHPEVSGELMGFGAPGPGEVTIYASPKHTFMSFIINGAQKFFGTHGSEGAGWYAGSPLSGYEVRHVPGAGGIEGMVNAPAVHGKGPIADAVKAALKKMAAAGNKYISGHMLSGMKAGASEAHGGFSMPQLEALWVQAGGPQSKKHLMAAIAEAESSGNPQSIGIPTSAGRAEGLWQILGLPFPGDPFNPLTNARMAVSKYKSQGLGAWETYTNGMYKRFMAVGGLLKKFVQGGLVNHLAMEEQELFSRGGLPQGHIRQFTDGGRYNRPTYLVGEEHQNEFVIATNPAYRASNEHYLKEAASELGFNLTPASKGNKKKKAKKLQQPGDVVSKRAIAELSVPSAYQAGGVDESQTDKAVSELEAALKKEETKKTNLLNEIDTARRTLAHDKEKDAVSIVKARRTVDYARQGAEHKNKHGKKSPSAERNLKKAEDRLAELEHRASPSTRHAAERLKHLEQGLRAVEHGGTYGHVKYVPLHTLQSDVKAAKKDQKNLKHYKSELEHYNSVISTEQKQLQNIASQYNNEAKHGHENVALKDQWNALIKQRRDDIKHVKDMLKGAKNAAEKFTHRFPSDAMTKLVDSLTGEEQDAIGAEGDNNEAESIGITGKEPTQVNAEEFIKSLGEGDVLASLNEAYALAQVNNVPDNPETPQNEELPALADDLTAAGNLKVFWESTLSKAQAQNEPPELITEIANDVKGARDTYFSLSEQLKQGQVAEKENAFNELVSYNKARDELYKNFGSNYKVLSAPTAAIASLAGGNGINPVWMQVPSAQAAVQSTGNAVFSMQEHMTPKHTTVNLTNHFSHPPPEPHAFSHGVLWELQAAM